MCNRLVLISLGFVSLFFSACVRSEHDCRSCNAITYKGYLHDYPYTYQGAMDTLKMGHVAYTVSTWYPETNPSEAIGRFIGTTCGCIPLSLRIYLDEGCDSAIATMKIWTLVQIPFGKF